MTSDLDDSDNENMNKRKLKHEQTNNLKKPKYSENELEIETESIFNNKKELYKAPTVEELNELRETEILFNSNLFRLQTEELLKEVLMKQKRKREIENWFEKFQQFVSKLPELNFETNTKLTSVLKQIKENVPLRLKSDQDLNLKLTKPSSIELSGLYKLKGLIGQTFQVVINIVMPKSYFYVKDFLNARYFEKRSFYLSYIATSLKTCDFIQNLSYTFLNGNHLVPILQITPKSIKNTIFNIVATPEENTFQLNRFNPEKINVRPIYFDSVMNEESAKETDSKISTPFYNSIILYDLLLNSNDKYQYDLLSEMKGACEGLVLLTIWLKQRFLDSGYGAFTPELMYSVLAHLAQLNKINKHMSSYQVIRHVWNYLSQTEWDKTGNNEHYDVIFMDRTNSYNFASNLDLNIYLQVQNEARKAVNYLDEASFNSFQSLFMINMQFHLQYDAVVNIFNADSIYNSFDYKQKLNYLTFKTPLILKHVSETLKMGLSNRICRIVPKLQSVPVWDIEQQLGEENVSISFGLEFDSSQIHRVIDKGPPAYDTLANRFREFWGERAELRRFKDGSICEAVHWPAKYISGKRKICKQIIEYLLEKKLNLINYNIVYDQFDTILESYQFETPVEESNLNIITTFDELGKLLRELKLPLSVSTIQGTSDAFCYTDAYPPVPTNYKCGHKVTYETNTNILFKTDLQVKVVPKYVAPITAIIQMVDHSKWPNDIEAMLKLRTAFYIQMAEQLTKHYNLKCNVSNEFLSVVYKGFVFRFVLYHPKQVALLRKHVDELGVMYFEDTESSLVVEKHCDVLPKVISALNGVHSQFPSYGPSTALIKRWFNAQLIDTSHISNMVLNLLNASLYLNSAPFTEPILPQIAFVRFLHYVSFANWTLQAVVVNFNKELTVEQLNSFDTDFQQNRSNYPPIFIKTPFDSKSLWTHKTPTKEILNRIRILASESLRIIESNIYTQQLFQIEGLFKPNLNGYNILIYLQPLLNPRRNESYNGPVENKLSIDYNEEDKNDKIPVVDFNPVEFYLQELRSNYDDFALFFHDGYGGNVIAVLWKPSVYEQSDFKVSDVGGKQLITSSKDKVQVNVDALVEDFYVLGNDIVKTIEKL